MDLGSIFIDKLGVSAQLFVFIENNMIGRMEKVTDDACDSVIVQSITWKKDCLC